MKIAKTVFLSLSAIALFILGGIIGVMSAILSTPLLWKLEEPTGLELAGHSGPGESVMWLFTLVFGTAFSGLFLRIRLRPIKKEQS